MQQRRVTLFFLFLGLILSIPVHAQSHLTPEIIVHLETVTEATLSPDGRTVAYVRRVQRTSEDDRGGPYSELFVLPARGGEPQQFTHRPHPVLNIQWSPDGRYIYFRSNRPGVHPGMQVYRIPVTGGEATPVTTESSSVLFYTLSPDGNLLAYVVQDPEPADISQRKRQGDDWIIADEYVRHRKLYIKNLQTDETKLITRHDTSVWDVEWAPDSRRLVYQASPLPDTDHSYMFKKMYLVDAAGNSEPELFVETEGKLGSMSWSPDGLHLAWHGAVDISDPTEGTIFVAHIATRRVTNILPNFEGTATWISWIDNSTIVFVSEEKTWTRMSTIAHTGGRRYLILDERQPSFTSAHFSNDRRNFIAVASTYNHPPEVYTGNIQRRTMSRLTNHNPLLGGMRFNNYEYIEYRARDGLLITGLLLKPIGYEEGKQYPLICQIHGGPEAAYTHGWNTTYGVMTQLYSHRGFMVFLPNYRASTGRGVEFAKANHRDGGGKEFTDVLDGIDYLDGRRLIDRSRVGIVGGSYGGYFANLAATRYAGNFAAAVSFVGISNQFSKTGITDTPLENILVHFDRAHYQSEHRIGIMETSPIWYLEQAVQPENETPLLIIHGENDRRVPYGQAEELYRGLKLSYKHHRNMTPEEIPVTFITYPRAGHGTNEVRQQLHFSRTVLEFFDKHLK